MDQPAFLGAQVAALTRDIHQLAQLRFVVDGGVLQRRLQSDQATEPRAGAIENPKRRAKNPGEQLQRPRREQRQPFSALQRKHLGHQLAEHDVQERNRRERDDDG